MQSEIESFDGRIAKVVGGPASGKTQALVLHAVELLKQGVDASSICIVVSNGFAAQAAAARVSSAAKSARVEVGGMMIATPNELAVEVLASDAARASTHRSPRVLSRAEYNFLLEDLKTTGASKRKLSNALRYFMAQTEGLKPRDEWMLRGEEEGILDALQEHLLSRGACLREELAALAANYLKGRDGKDARGMFTHVLADDFQNMSYAQQTLTCLLASRQLIVAGCADETTTACTDNPNPDGFERFDKTRYGVELFELGDAHIPQAISNFITAILAQGNPDPAAVESNAEQATDSSSLSAVKWATPDDELNGLARYIAHMLKEAQGSSHGSHGSHATESRTGVLVPNKLWGTMIGKALARNGIKASLCGVLGQLSGDPRDTRRARALLAYTKICLLADAQDVVSWRSWCGFDHALANSAAWKELLAFAKSEGCSVLEALMQAGDHADEIFTGSRTLGERVRDGRDFIVANANYHGYALMKAVGAEELPEFEYVRQTMVGDEDVQTLAEMMRRATTDPIWPDDPHAVHIGMYDSFCGQAYDNIFVMGAVNGFIPRRDAFEVVSTEDQRKQIMDADRRCFVSCAAKAGRCLVVSYFSKSDLELAERHKMQVSRIKAEHGRRVALVRPTCFLGEAGDAAPSTIGGQALLAASR